MAAVSMLVWAAGFVTLGWFAFLQGGARVEVLQLQAQTDADQRLRDAGFPWAHLVIDQTEGRLLGDAPDADSLAALQTAAGPLLQGFVGLPGIVGHIENRTGLSACGGQLHAALALPRVRFESGAHHLDPGSEPMLRELARLAEQCQNWRIVIESTIDDSAYERGMRRLGQRRAQAVAAALMLQGVPVERIESRVATSADPLRGAHLHVELEHPGR